MELIDLCRETGMPEEVTEQILYWDGALDWDALSPAVSHLAAPGCWEQGQEEIRAALGEDDRGFRELTVFARCALRARENYQKLGLSDSVFLDTMGCFSRFVKEHRESFGCYGFDRGFWTVRQVSCLLFRIGTLEYELLEEDGERVISLHIPSNAVLDHVALRRSYEQARSLISRVFPDYAAAPMVCESWLLSPDLEALLPERSRILSFQRAFRIRPAEEESEVRLWVFKNPDLPLDELPEDTSLQRSLKRFLLEGNTFRDGAGVLTEDPFV